DCAVCRHQLALFRQGFVACALRRGQLEMLQASLGRSATLPVFSGPGFPAHVWSFRVPRRGAFRLWQLSIESHLHSQAERQLTMPWPNTKTSCSGFDAGSCLRNSSHPCIQDGNADPTLRLDSSPFANRARAAMLDYSTMLP